MYEFSDTTAEHDLAAAARRGVPVRVILDHREKSVNSGAYSYFRSHDVKVTWSSPDYRYTHQRTPTGPTSRRSPRCSTPTSPSTPFTPATGPTWFWSPTDSQDQLIALINGARSSLRIYSEEIGDATVEKALIAAAKRGMDVQVCGENESGEYDTAFAGLSRGGVRISYYSSSTGFYIHGKVVEADYGTARAKVFIGSENFSGTSLNQNRELGLITSSHAVMSAIARTFAADFRSGKHWS